MHSGQVKSPCLYRRAENNILKLLRQKTTPLQCERRIFWFNKSWFVLEKVSPQNISLLWKLIVFLQIQCIKSGACLQPIWLKRSTGLSKDQRPQEEDHQLHWVHAFWPTLMMSLSTTCGELVPALFYQH